MASPTFTVAALVDELTAITCPVDRAVEVSRLAGQFGNLPPALAKVRRDALQEARDTGRKVGWLADQVRLTPGRIYQLTITRRGRKAGPAASHRANGGVQTATPPQPPKEA